MVSFYLDVSGSPGHRVLASGGYIATNEEWRKFDRAWAEILKDAGVRAFHATDFFACRGEFKSWQKNSNEQNTYSARFCRAAAKHLRYGFAYGVDLDHFDVELGPILRKSKTPHRRYTPTMFALAKVLNNAAQRVLPPRGPRAAVIFESGEGVGEVIDYLNFLRSRKEGWIEAYASFGTAQKEHRPLQAADLLAHEAWRRITEVLKPTGRAVRKPMALLLDAKRVEIKYASRDDFKASAKGIAMFLEKRPDYAQDS